MYYLTENRNIVTVDYTTANKTVNAVVLEDKTKKSKAFRNIVICGEY